MADEPAELNDSDVLRILTEANDQIALYTIAFIDVRMTAGELDAHVVGSGTLVTIDGTSGILTADHVVNSLPKRGPVGLALYTPFKPQLHSFTFEMDWVEKIQVAKWSKDSIGPDLHFLILPARDVETIKARKSFFNLSRRRDRMTSDPPPTHLGAWFLAGTPAERTTDAAPVPGLLRVKNFGGMTGASLVGERYSRDGYDYLKFEVDSGDDDDVPASFGGVSGGGAWQAILERSERGELRVAEMILSGVAFYESNPADGPRTVTCHGVRSVYKNVIDTVRARADQ